LQEGLKVLQLQLETLTQQTGLEKADHDEALDTIWMLVASMLVFFMHAGFSMLETGSVRLKNTQNIMAKNLIVVTFGFLCWFLIGWPLAYGDGKGNKFAGGSNFLTDGFLNDSDAWYMVGYRNWFFQGAFCATGGTIVSGAMAERTQLKGFCIYVIAMTTIIYPIVVFWGWSGSGFLNYIDEDCDARYVALGGCSIVGPKLYDFAGSGIVHMVGGVAALCGAVIVGPRKGRFDEVVDESFDAHNMVFIVLGTFFLWFGWYGFNPGSTLSMKTASDGHIAGLVAVNTTLAPCVAGLVVFGLRRFVCPPKTLDVGGFCNGILAGLVSITAACGWVQPWESCLIGFIGGFVYQGASMLLRKLKVDDVVDAFPVHGACGCWGVLAAGFFGDKSLPFGGNGVFYGGDQLGTQVVAVLVIGGWSAVLSCLVFLPLKIAGVLRLSDEFQKSGADELEHFPPKAYAEGVAMTAVI